MAKTREQKKKEIENLSSKLKDAKSVVFSNFDQVGVKDLESLRKELRQNEAELVIIKKTFLKKALEANKMADVKADSFNGSASVVLGYKDEVMPAKLVSKFKKGHESVNLLGGILENRYIDLAEVENLAQLPSREELLARIVGSLRAPVANLVGICSGVLRSFVYALKAISDDKK